MGPASSSRVPSWSLQLKRFLSCSCFLPNLGASSSCEGLKRNKGSEPGSRAPSGMPKQLRPSAAPTEAEASSDSSQPTSIASLSTIPGAAPTAAVVSNSAAKGHLGQPHVVDAFTGLLCSTHCPAAQQGTVQSTLLARRQQRYQQQMQTGGAEPGCQVSGSRNLSAPTGTLQPMLVTSHFVHVREPWCLEACHGGPTTLQQLSEEGINHSSPALTTQLGNRRRSCYADTPTGQPQETVLQEIGNCGPPWQVQGTSAAAHASVHQPTKALDMQDSEELLGLLQQGTTVGGSNNSSSSSAMYHLAALQGGAITGNGLKQHRRENSNTAGTGTVFADAVCDDSLLPNWQEYDDELSSPTGRRLIEVQDESAEAEQLLWQQEQDGSEVPAQQQQPQAYREGSGWTVPRAQGSDYLEEVGRVWAALNSFTFPAQEGPMGNQLYEVLRLSVLGPVSETVRVRGHGLPNPGRAEGLHSMDVAEVSNSRYTEDWPEDSESGARTFAWDELGRPLYVSQLPGARAVAGPSTRSAESEWQLNGLLGQAAEDGFVSAVEVDEEGEGCAVWAYVTSCPALVVCDPPGGMASDLGVEEFPLHRPATG